MYIKSKIRNFFNYKIVLIQKDIILSESQILSGDDIQYLYKYSRFILVSKDKWQQLIVAQTFGLTLKTNILIQAGCLLIHDMSYVLGECIVENRPLR